MKGRVVVLKDYGAPFEIEEYEVPYLLSGAVLVKVTQAGICGSDLHSWRGDRDKKLQPIPAAGSVMGHEGSGVVAALSARASSPLGRQARARGRPTRALLGPCLLPLPPVQQGQGEPLHQPARQLSGGCGGVAVLRRHLRRLLLHHPRPSLLRRARGPEGRVAVLDQLRHGNPPPRASTMRAARWATTSSSRAPAASACALRRWPGYRGAATITVLDRMPERLALARRFGATHTIDISEQGTVEERTATVREITEGDGADIVMELVGVTELIPEGVGYLAPGGTLVEIGHVMAGRTFSLDPRAIIRNKSILGSSGYRPQLLPGLMDLMLRTQDAVPYDQIVSHRFPLADVNIAIDASNGRADRPPSPGQC